MKAILGRIGDKQLAVGICVLSGRVFDDIFADQADLAGKLTAR